jgi:hypothetical protein
MHGVAGMTGVAVLAMVSMVACAGAGRAPTAPVPAPAAAAAKDESRFGPLDVGADFHSYRRVTSEPFLSRVHGNRWVHVWVNEVGADAYVDGGDIPVGTIVVKESWVDDGGKPGSAPGPIYVMRKEKPGYAPEHEDWFFAIHWARPTPDASGKVMRPLYWRGASPKVAYCYDCHDSYDRGLGGLVPSSVLYR